VKWLLDALWVGVIIIAFVCTVIVIVSLSAPDRVNAGFGTSVRLKLDAYPDARTGSRAEISNLRGEITWSDEKPPSIAVVVGILCSGTLAFAVLFFVLHQLRQVVSTAAEGDPFVPENGSRIRALGWVVLVGEVLKAVVSFASSSYLHQQVSLPGMTVEPCFNFQWSTIFLGLVILAIAEIFRAGATMREEQALTI
jgi:hypothetical protein